MRRTVEMGGFRSFVATAAKGEVAPISGRSPNRDQTFGLAVIRRGELIVLIENNVVVHTDHGMIWLGGRSDEVRK
jgi:hypothetical protein